jgi:hypothetical protein
VSADERRRLEDLEEERLEDLGEGLDDDLENGLENAGSTSTKFVNLHVIFSFSI